jgi:hypothetical protein
MSVLDCNGIVRFLETEGGWSSVCVFDADLKPLIFVNKFQKQHVNVEELKILRELLDGAFIFTEVELL